MIEEGPNLKKKSCNCSRKIIVLTRDKEVPVCGYCKTYGIQESKRLLVLEKLEIRKKNLKTQYQIKVGKIHTIEKTI